MTLRLLTYLLAAALLFTVSSAAVAHSASSSYLQIGIKGQALSVQWSIALRDLDYAIGLDSNDDGAITWGEVLHHRSEIDAYALARLELTGDGKRCTPGPVDHLADELGDGGYVVLRFTAECPAPPQVIGVHYALLFDLDPLHRGLLNVTIGGAPHATALSPARPDAQFDVNTDYRDTVSSFFIAGIQHLLSGIDHLLFVTMLLVPAMFYRRKDGHGTAALMPVPGFTAAFIETIKVLSAFTLAHATTLTLSVLHIVNIPQRYSETGIALTILITALDNIWRVLPEKRWPLAFAFGLIHGLGFANALGPLELPPLALAAALVSFNLGLEAAQIIVAAVVLPFGFLARKTWFYPHRVVPGVSAAVALVAFAWFTDRAIGLNLMPF